jgi:hypothetical protein
MPIDTKHTVPAMATTPTRRVGDTSSLNDSLENMSISGGEGSGVESSNGTLGGSHPSTPGFAYVANGNLYNLPSDAIPFMMPSMNSCGIGAAGPYIPNMNQHSAWGINGFTRLTPTSFAQQGIMPNLYGRKFQPLLYSILLPIAQDGGLTSNLPL